MNPLYPVKENILVLINFHLFKNVTIFVIAPVKCTVTGFKTIFYVKKHKKFELYEKSW